MLHCRSSSKAQLHLAVVLSALATSAADGVQYGHVYTGDGTYYGDFHGAGACSFEYGKAYTRPWTRGLARGVAMNAPQYGGSEPCGMCVAYRGTGQGAGADPVPVDGLQYALVTDLCPECAHGALDQASFGDGRWGIAWTPVQCPVGTGQDTSHFFYSFQGSNPWYLKLQIANTRVPVRAASIMGPKGWEAMQRSTDNYFLARGGVYQFPTAIRLTSILGDTVTDSVPAAAFTSADHSGAFGGAQFPFNRTLSEVGALRLAAGVKGALSK
ncbi:hypothetical protein WJX81_002137 [Elliptochloris bilobata]|uniref:Expansin-like EG45 domain-containing protein n=1 Tax=Elliptochloris bilobata TaxID=381761 RepID=A0AAW1S6S1_9CHLO